MSLRLGSGKPRVATGLEDLGAQGFHLFESTTKDYPLSARGRILRDCPASEQTHLSGNGMHLGVLCHWLYYVLSNCVRIDGAFELRPLPNPAGVDSDSSSSRS